MLSSQQFSQEQLQLLLNWETELEKINWPISIKKSGQTKLMICIQMLTLIKEIPQLTTLSNQLPRLISITQRQLWFKWETESEEMNWPISIKKSGPIKHTICTQTLLLIKVTLQLTTLLSQPMRLNFTTQLHWLNSPEESEINKSGLCLYLRQYV